MKVSFVVATQISDTCEKWNISFEQFSQKLAILQKQNVSVDSLGCKNTNLECYLIENYCHRARLNINQTPCSNYVQVEMKTCFPFHFTMSPVVQNINTSCFFHNLGILFVHSLNSRQLLILTFSATANDLMMFFQLQIRVVVQLFPVCSRTTMYFRSFVTNKLCFDE